jgi:hypothetical protein
MMSFMNLSISDVETLKFTLGERGDENLLDVAGVFGVATSSHRRQR